MNRLRLAPRGELLDFAERAVALYKTQPKTQIPALCWGVAVVCYPFFGKVAELVGRLSAFQDGCVAADAHRRMSEIYGERESTLRMTNILIQIQASRGAI